MEKLSQHELGKALKLTGISKIFDDLTEEAEVPDTERSNHRFMQTQQAQNLSLSRKVISLNLKTPVSHGTHFIFDKELLGKT